MSDETKMELAKGENKVGRPSKIESNNLVDVAINLLKVYPKMTYQQIADELNAAGSITEDPITATNVINFSKTFPDVRRQVLMANRAHLRKLMFESADFDMLHMLKDMAARLTFMIDAYEESAMEGGYLPKPSEYKALNSELRETLKQIEGIHKEIYDMDVVRTFLLEVVKTLQEISPEALSAFVTKMRGKRENSHIVSEILKGGI